MYLRSYRIIRATPGPTIAVPAVARHFAVPRRLWLFHQYPDDVRHGTGDRLLVDDAIVVVENAERVMMRRITFLPRE